MNKIFQKLELRRIATILVLLFPFGSIQQCTCCCASEESIGQNKCCSSESAEPEKCCCASNDAQTSKTTDWCCKPVGTNGIGTYSQANAGTDESRFDGVDGRCGQCKCACLSFQRSALNSGKTVASKKSSEDGIVCLSIPPTEVHWDNRNGLTQIVGVIPTKSGNLRQSYLNVWLN